MRRGRPRRDGRLPRADDPGAAHRRAGRRRPGAARAYLGAGAACRSRLGAALTGRRRGNDQPRRSPEHGVRRQRRRAGGAHLRRGGADLMAAIRVLERLTGAQWRLLESYGEILPLAEGQVIIAEGQIEEAFYIVLSGVLQVITRGPGGETLLGRFPAGSLFGEVGFLDGGPRTATV